MSVAPVVAVRGLSKRYRRVVALDKVSLDLHAGEVLALLGPNGAGKTTLLEIIEGVRKPTSGEVIVFGERPAKLTKSTRARIGVQLQSVASFRPIAVGEFLDLWVVAFNRQTTTQALLELVGLASRAKTRLSKLSVGQQQRLMFAAALAGNPDLLILDEPTSNLDPQSRRRVWSEIRRRAADGAAVLFATHQLDEAEQFCDRVAIIDHGRIAAWGTPAELVREHFSGACTVSLTTDAVNVDSCRETAGLSISVDAPTEDGSARVSWQSDHPRDVVCKLSSLLARNVDVAALRVDQHSLGDVYIHFTGADIRA